MIAPHSTGPLGVALCEIAEYGTGEHASMRQRSWKHTTRNQFGALSVPAGREGAASVRRIRRRGSRGRIQRFESRLSLRRDMAVFIFPHTEKQEWNRGRSHEQFCPARDFGRWLQSTKLPA